MTVQKIKIKYETGRCLLCHEAACSKACSAGIPADRIIRSLRFDNEAGAAALLAGNTSCLACDAPCMKVCSADKITGAIRIPEIMKALSDVSEKAANAESKVSLAVDFCGVHCENPFFLSSSIVGSNYEMVAKAFDMGWAGVAFKTIGTFVPEETSPRFAALEKEENPMIGFKNIEQISDHTLAENMGYLKKLKEDYPTKIIIASIMGQNEEEWTYLAKCMEEAGADIIECNFSCPHMSGEGLGSDVGTNPELVSRYTKATRKGTKLPILAKMTPNITNMEIPALAAKEAGADGLAAINTIKSVMNVNLDSYASAPNVSGKSAVGGYSGKAVKPIALRFVHDLKSDAKVGDLPLSGMGGIETWKDAMEFMALGCGTIQITTAVMQYGYRIIEDLISGTEHYLRSQGLTEITPVIGKALEHIVPAEALDRKTIEYPKFDLNRCVGCGRCYISCYDGGHQAIVMDPETGKPKLKASSCVGCQLCRLVCPAGSIGIGKRVIPRV